MKYNKRRLNDGERPMAIAAVADAMAPADPLVVKVLALT